MKLNWFLFICLFKESSSVILPTDPLWFNKSLLIRSSLFRVRYFCYISVVFIVSYSQLCHFVIDFIKDWETIFHICFIFLYVCFLYYLWEASDIPLRIDLSKNPISFETTKAVVYITLVYSFGIDVHACFHWGCDRCFITVAILLLSFFSLDSNIYLATSYCGALPFAELSVWFNCISIIDRLMFCKSSFILSNWHILHVCQLFCDVA